MAREPKPEYKKIAAEVRKRRKSRGWSQSRLAEHVNVSASLVSYWELAVHAPQLKEARRLDELFGTSGVFAQLWSKSNSESIYPAGSQNAIDFERTAVEIREFHTTLVPGLLQTPRYARAIFKAGRPWASASSLEQKVESRLRRQSVLEVEERPLLWIVLDEIVIRRVLGDVATMKEQLDHLLHLVTEGIICLQVVPLSLRLPPGLSGPFRVFVFSDRPMVVASEYVADDMIIDDDEQVRECATLFGAIQAGALSTSDSFQLVQQVRGELDD
ncbi:MULTISPECIES: helix-turn-helix transcriptional regulator [unclassified Nocardiopsis]|uniref:helix-turn-helix domain-containing protein n=1 Tax=unclassified Nocardiopsis TaxID=2649073 RepID=UPI00135B5954|nr:MULTISPECIES: helix-turn-helix transcriptional regulator [unclassified Nocardiopsis]